MTPASTDPGQPLHVLALACSALGLQLALQKTFWDTTKLEILGIQIDSVQQSVSITSERCIHILEAIDNLHVPQRLGIPGQQIPWRLEEICGLDTVDKGGWSWKLFG